MVEAIHNVGSIEGEWEQQGDLHGGEDKAPQQGGHNEGSALAPTHDVHIVQGLGGGHVVIKGHHRERENICPTKDVEEEHLCHAACI